MDMSSIITAGLTGLVTLMVCLINNHYQTSRTNALISYRLEQLEHKVDRHNNLIDRMYKIEEQTALQQDEINRHKERLRALESKGGAA